MTLIQKLEELKQKPEHIRVRYVWASVAVSMVFIIVIWFFSIQARVSSTAEQDSKATDDLQSQLNKIKDATPSINDLMGTPINPSEGVNSDNSNTVPSQDQNANSPAPDQSAPPASQDQTTQDQNQNQNASNQSQSDSQNQVSNQSNNNTANNQAVKGEESTNNNSFPIAQ